MMKNPSPLASRLTRCGGWSGANPRGVTTRFHRATNPKVVAVQRFRIIDLLPCGQKTPSQNAEPSWEQRHGLDQPAEWSMKSRLERRHRNFRPVPGGPDNLLVPAAEPREAENPPRLAPLAESRLTPRIAFATWSSKLSGPLENPRTSKLSETPDALRPRSILLYASPSKAVEVDRGRC
jgi:hypothetical protein